MVIKGIVWIDEFVEKLHWKHNVSQQEVREVFSNKPKFRFVEQGHRPNENVYFASGRTSGGRYLIIYFIHKVDKRALIVSGRDMTCSERRRHGRK